MKKFKIALANDIDIFNIKNLLDIEFARKYHAVGIHYLIKKIIDNQYEIQWGNDAIDKIEKGHWKAKDVLIIQEMSSKYGKKLKKLGAVTFLCMCFEGPFIGHWFYEKINYFGQNFKKMIIFDDKYDTLKFNKNKILNIGFPCIEENFLTKKFVPLSREQWNKKNLIVGIWSNKHYSMHFKKIYDHLKNYNFKYLLLELISKLISKTYKKNLKFQIIDKRNQIFLNISKFQKFDLFGRGWNNDIEMPNRFYKKLKNYKNSIFDCLESKNENRTKKEIFNNYKFCLCFENSISRSYVTEKIFDCFKNNIIPIYLGAPNINEIVPKNCFIDYRKFKSDEDMIAFLNEMDTDKANNYLMSAHIFLKSNKSKLNSCEYFAKKIVLEIDKFTRECK